MREVIFHPEVEQEVGSSYRWYEKQAAGLGEDFLKELDAACQTIAELPFTWPKFDDDFRRFLLGRFPFSVIYRVVSQTVYVVAVMHNSRKPEYWNSRT